MLRSCLGAMQLLMSRAGASAVPRGLQQAARSQHILRAVCVPSRQTPRQTAFVGHALQQLSSVGSSRSVVAAAASTDAATDAGQADAAKEETGVYDAEYSHEYVNYHCITGTLSNLMFDESKDAGGNPVLWVTFTLQVAASKDVVDDYHIYLGGSTQELPSAYDLARDAMDKLHNGDYVQVGGAMRLNTPYRPKIFAHSIGKLRTMSPQQQVQYLETPDLPEHIAARAFPRAPAQQWQPAAGAAAGVTAAARGAAAGAGAAGGAVPAPANAPLNPPGMPAAPSTEHEGMWISLFQENHLWADRRLVKTGNQPDFVKRDKPPGQQNSPALWVVDRRTPAWAMDSLALLPGGQPYTPPALPPYIPAAAATSSYDVERLWVELFTNYTDFWDNRENKLNPRAPDFKAKDKASNKALWIEGKGTPAWVLSNLDKLPKPPPRRS